MTLLLSKPKMELILGDCLKILPTIPDKSIDLILTDPPYGIGFCSSRTSRKEKIQNDGYNDWLDLIHQVLPEFKRVLTDTGCCCCGGGGGGKTPVTAIFTMEAIKHFNLIQTLVWKKFIGLGWRYRPSYENIVVLSKDDKNYNFYDTSKKCSNVIEGINQDIPEYKKDNGRAYDEHPTQKPVALMKHLLSIHSLPEHTVLDPFAGSFTTGVACKEMGRNFIGVELKQEYYDYGVNRLKEATTELFI